MIFHNSDDIFKAEALQRTRRIPNIITVVYVEKRMIPTNMNPESLVLKKKAEEKGPIVVNAAMVGAFFAKGKGNASLESRRAQ